jgi:hypothetical protein
VKARLSKAGGVSNVWKVTDRRGAASVSQQKRRKMSEPCRPSVPYSSYRLTQSKRRIARQISLT